MTDQAVRVVRRRRTMARLVPVAAALLVVAVPVAVTRPSSSDGGGQQPSTSVADLPQRLTPEKSPPPLPEDHGVGPATLAFVSGGKDVVLLAADGRQYHVNALSVQGISPDGRWLLVLQSPLGPWVLRDLTGAGRQQFEGDTTFSASWSPDSRRLVVQTSRRSGATYMVDLTTGARSTVPLDRTIPRDGPGSPAPSAASTAASSTARWTPVSSWASTRTVCS